MESKGWIGSLNKGIVKGWVVCDEGNIGIYHGDEHIANVDELYLRQDIIDLGYTDKEAGFGVDISEYLSTVAGDITISLKQGDEQLANIEIHVPSRINLINNSNLTLQDYNHVLDWQVISNHRIGLSLSSFMTPKSVKHGNGSYTRFAFGDTNNTRHLLELIPTLSVENSEVQTLKLAVVAKASHEAHLQVLLIDSNGQRVLQEPILLTPKWSHQVVELDDEITSGLLSNELQLKLVAKHHGRRFIDIAMVQLSEGLIAPSQNTISAEQADDFFGQNILLNGDLKRWPNGVLFSYVRRGQELAENWFLEMSKSNMGNVAVAVVSDRYQSDPLSNTLESKFGLRVRTRQLDGYARLIVPFSKSHLSCVDYQFELEAEALSLDKKTTIPRIYIIARDAYNDTIVHDVARKHVMTGREKVKFILDAKAVSGIIEKSANYPVLTLAIGLPDNSDFCLYSLSLTPADKSLELEEEPEEETVSQAAFLAFEDSSITSQLTILKGLELWRSEITVRVPEVDNDATSSAAALDSLGHFRAHIFSLSPHKLARPSREYPIVDIIVPVYNACDDVLLCLSSLIEKTDVLHRIFVINDGEDERTAEMLDAFNCSFNHLEVINNDHNLGYTKSVNKGISHSNADWVVVLNSDTIVSDNWLSKLLNCALSTEKVGMVGALSNAASWQSVPQIHDNNGDWHLNPIPDGMTIDDIALEVATLSQREYPEVGVINGFCQLINTSMLDEIGLLDEVAFPIGYGEENDMCARAVKAGYKLLIADDTYIFHAKSKSFGHDKRKALAKQGSAALKKKHPDVNWGKVTRLIFENPGLVDLRKKLATRLEEKEVK